jgi:predicted ArsR family transcriptional regulator
MENEFVASDANVLELMLEQDSATVSELAESMQVTATAVRQRLMRLMAQGLVERSAAPSGRGRPSHRYRLTTAGRRKSGVNFADLAIALWREIREIEDPKVKQTLISGLSHRLASMYAGAIQGDSLEEKMQSLAEFFNERRIPFTVDSQNQEPVLRILACPYPELAEQDRTVCSMESQIFTEVLGKDVHLDRCRLDGNQCCEFATGEVPVEP